MLFLVTLLFLAAATPETTPETITELRTRAEQGDASAHFDLCRKYALGEDVPRDVEVAVKWLRSAAERGSVEAQWVFIGLAVEKLDVPQNIKDSMREGLGEKEGKLEVLQDFATLVTRQELLKRLHMSAEDGEPFAQLLLGFASEDDEALRWFRKAAEQLGTEVQLGLAAMLLEGEYGVPRNLNEGVKWLRRAAEQESADAQWLLAQVHKGEEYEELRDPRKARKWLHMAAEQGLILAQVDLGFAYLQGTITGQNYRLAEEWFVRAAKQGDTTAKITLGMMYEEGKTTQGEIDEEAYFWYILAAADGDSDAQKARERVALNLTATQRSLQQDRAGEFMEKHEGEGQ